MKKRFSATARLYALEHQRVLLQHSLAPWPRRGTRMLEINCGRGSFLPLLWQCGFELTATEAHPQARLRAQRSAPAGVDIQAAADDSLPFDDNTFDWAVLHVQADDDRALQASMREALRVAARGMAITCWNRTSLPWLCRSRGQHQPDWPPHARQLWSLWRQLRALRAGRLHWRSTLLWPVPSWNDNCVLSRCNGWLQSLPLGAWLVFRLDMGPLRPVTPLPLRLERRSLGQTAPILQYEQKMSSAQPHTEDTV